MSTTIIVDTREQRPWCFDDIPSITVERAYLETGDYSVKGFEDTLCVERKSADDFCNTVLRRTDAFYNELRRMARFRHACVVVEATYEDLVRGRYKSQVKPKALRGFIYDLITNQGVPVYLVGTRASAQNFAGGLLEYQSLKKNQ